ncbi:DUF2017 domain-containing protein [Corynebacterium alimapuense]|uniref:DUF2017 domain-containing protein n=1 Tax=Corynebacterium alimapuense TaxID=1576874 RepID=A0A3M8KA02_9CORY|nr:DUF2017 domain-containing protein [Corynebacterium alimapuense]RNE49699.1 DUF2017 domain-containing protein [Corynebacterium alimapuense]
MKAWRKKRSLRWTSKYVTVLEPMERELLGNLTAMVSEAIILRAQSAPKDELSELTGIPSGHKEAPQDPAMARLLPDFERSGDEEYEGDNSLLRSLHENDICRSKLANLQIVAEAVGPDGGVELSLSESQAHSFLAALNDLRLYLSASENDLGIPGLGKEDMIEWLSFNQDSLLGALMGE